MSACKRFVLTGGPGAGKTSVIEALARRGEFTTVEAGRAVIAAHADAGLPPPWLDPIRFATLMLEHDIGEFERAATHAGAAFFDRGVPDLCGYLALMNRPIPEHISRAAESFRYERIVFLFPPWREIYRQDAERTQDFAEATWTFDVMVAAYEALGYALLEVPRGSVEQRADFLLAHTVA